VLEALFWGFGRSSVGARALEGSDEAELAPEAKGGRASRGLRPRPKGRASRCLRPRPRGRASQCLCPSLGNRVWFALSFVIFIALIWVSLFTVHNSSPQAFEGVTAPFQRFFFKGIFCLTWSFSLSPEGARERTLGCSPRAFWRNGVIHSKAFTPECCSREYLRDRLRVLYVVPIPIVRGSPRALSPQGSIRFFLVL